MAAAHFGTSSYYVGTYYDTYAAKDQQQREWKFMSDASIKAQRKEGKIRFDASPEYRTEMVSPICRYEDIVTVQELIRKLREAGAFANKSCGIHVHIDASPFDARTLRNITNIMAASVFRRLHAKCVEEVKRLNGAVELGDAYKYQKREN